MLCYVGKATKIFFFLVAAVVTVGLVVGISHLSRGRAHKGIPATCPGGGSGPCNSIPSFPDPATAAAVPPPPPQGSVLVGPANIPPPAAASVSSGQPAASVSAPPPAPAQTTAPPWPAPPADTAVSQRPVISPPGPTTGAMSPGQPS